MIPQRVLLSQLRGPVVGAVRHSARRLMICQRPGATYVGFTRRINFCPVRRQVRPLYVIISHSVYFRNSAPRETVYRSGTDHDMCTFQRTLTFTSSLTGFNVVVFFTKRVRHLSLNCVLQQLRCRVARRTMREPIQRSMGIDTRGVLVMYRTIFSRFRAQRDMAVVQSCVLRVLPRLRPHYGTIFAYEGYWSHNVTLLHRDPTRTLTTTYVCSIVRSTFPSLSLSV